MAKEEETTLKEKLLKFQGKVEAIAKNSKNPFFKQNYFDINKLIEDVKPVLNECGILLLQPLTHIDGSPALQTILTDTKESLEFTVPLPQDQNPQKQGAIITYFRRYALTSLLFLQAEDDDANSTSTHQEKATTKTTKPEPQKETPETEQGRGWLSEKQEYRINKIYESDKLTDIERKNLKGEARELKSKGEARELMGKWIKIIEARGKITKGATNPQDETPTDPINPKFADLNTEPEVDKKLKEMCDIKSMDIATASMKFLNISQDALTLEDKEKLINKMNEEL